MQIDTSAALRCPELLAPAGDWECARAAVENGADAVYFGLERFNARMRAQNFTEADLPALVAYLHSRGVKGYVTFNTLVFASEMADAEQYLRSIIASGVDAAIVQDIGVCRLIRQISPDFPIHLSTQATVTSAAGVEFARELGCNLVVLARECSIAEIKKIREATAGGPLPLEVFVHGALCVAYSGQCLTSEALGGRSANRGECAQACRMPYDLIADGEVVDLGDRKYLLSPQDLAGLEVLPELVRAGLSSLKIEGRLKAPEYVANITRVYRQALDRVIVELGMPEPQPAALMSQLKSESRYDLEMGFSRGLHTGWLQGIDNQQLAHARFAKKRGVYLGEVEQVRMGGVRVHLVAPLKPGDGVVFDAGHPERSEAGGRVYAVEAVGSDSRVTFSRDFDLAQVQVGDKLWKTSDPELDRRLLQSYTAQDPQFRRPLAFTVHGCAGGFLTLEARDELGNTVQASSTILLAAAQNQALGDERLTEQLGRLGGTPFFLASLDNHLEGPVYLPMSELNQVRRTVIEQLLARRAQPRCWQVNERCPVERQADAPVSRPAELIVLVRSLAQLGSAIESGIETIYCELEDVRRYREAVKIAHNHGVALWAAPPRIAKMGEEWILKQVRASEADGYLVRNYDHLKYFAGERLVGDFSLNVANPLTAQYFIEHCGLERLSASYDLNIDQLSALLVSAPSAWFEVTIHQHMPMFHMEHCVFCAFLTDGTDYTNCGRPCETQTVRLRDRVGAEHLLKADAGCRNTVFNARAQTGAEFVHRLLTAGARHLRLEFLDETPETVKRTIDAYRRLLGGKLSGSQLWRELKLLNQLGVTRGQVRST